MKLVSMDFALERDELNKLLFVSVWTDVEMDDRRGGLRLTPVPVIEELRCSLN